MNSYRIGFSECEHERASNGQHVRRRLFSRYVPACQEQNSDQFGLPPRPVTSHLSRSPGAQEVPINGGSQEFWRYLASQTGWRCSLPVPPGGRAFRPSPQAAPDRHARLLSAFCEAAASGDISALAGLLREDAIAITDGGGRKTAALNPIKGAQKIIRFLIGISGKNAGRDIRIVPMMINGRAGALLYLDGEIDHTLSVAIDGEKIAAIYLVRNPDKLRHAPDAAPGARPN